MAAVSLAELIQSQEPRAFFFSGFRRRDGFQGFELSYTALPGHKQVDGWEVDQPGHGLVPIWDVAFAGGGLAK